MTIKDYVDGLMKNCVNVILKRHKTPSLHLVGYCMGGTMSAIFTARNPDLVKTLTIMAAPIDFGVGKDDSLVHLLVQPRLLRRRCTRRRLRQRARPRSCKPASR